MPPKPILGPPLLINLNRFIKKFTLNQKSKMFLERIKKLKYYSSLGLSIRIDFISEGRIKRLRNIMIRQNSNGNLC